jgi:magnesium transporter
MIRTLYRNREGKLRTDLKPEEFAHAINQPNNLLWIDFEGEPDAVTEPILREIFGFHHLAIEDALKQAHVAKVDDWGEYIYIVCHSMTFDFQRSTYLETEELDIFLGKNYLVTHHDTPIPALEATLNSCLRDERHIKRGPDHLLYRILDELVTGYLPIIDTIDEAVNEIEDLIFQQAGPHIIGRIFSLKRALLTMRRIIDPQREVLNKLARDTYPVIDPKDRIFFRDVYDHLVRLHDINESMRDLVGGSLDTYLSVVGNRMNEVMRTLTVITTMFMPISFIAGFFGMNFFAASDPQEPWMTDPAFFLTMALMIISPLTMYLWIKARRWV